MAIISINPTKDTYIDQHFPGNNYGGNPFMIEEGTSTGYTRIGLVEFSLSGISSVSSAILNLNNNYSSSSDGVIASRITDNTWAELGVTWNNAPAYTSTNQTTITVGGSGWYSWDVTNMINDAITAGSGVIGFRIASNSTSMQIKHFLTKENGSLIPYLSITYCPNPTCNFIVS